MPRYRRHSAPETVQHLISRFVGGRFLFEVSGARSEYLRRVTAVLDRCDWIPISFALMSSHVHWVLVAGHSPSSAFIKPLHAGFARWINERIGGPGPVFAERHRSIVCEGDTAAGVVAYVHNNPVRADIVRNAAASGWTSHRAYLGLETAPQWLDVSLGLKLCGFAASQRGRRQFDDFVDSRAGDPRDTRIAEARMARQRAAARRLTQNPVELAGPVLKPGPNGPIVETTVVETRACPARGSGPPWPGEPLAVVEAVATVTGLETDQVRSRSRVRRITAARRLALLVWSEALSRATIEMARALGIGGSAACELLGRATRSDRQQAAEVARKLRYRAQ